MNNTLSNAVFLWNFEYFKKKKQFISEQDVLNPLVKQNEWDSVVIV